MIWMERLTTRTPKGAAVKMDEPADELEARKQLMEKFHAVCEKLAHFEDLQEAGRLVELPCAVGDTVYGIFCDEVYPKKIIRIEINPHTNPQLWMGTKFDFSSGTIDRIDMVLGKTVFLTREEAEAALKGGGQE